MMAIIDKDCALAASKRSGSRPGLRAYGSRPIPNHTCSSLPVIALFLVVVMILYQSPREVHDMRRDTKPSVTLKALPQEKKQHHRAINIRAPSSEANLEISPAKSNILTGSMGRTNKNKATDKPKTAVMKRSSSTSHATEWQTFVQQAKDKKYDKREFATPDAQEACARHVKSWIFDLTYKEEKIYSQFGEDGVTKYILQQLAPETLLGGTSNLTSTGTTNDHVDTDRFYVEFGVENGMQGNTRILREHYNWTGVMLDGGYFNPGIGLQQEMIKPDNIVDLFEKYKVPKTFGVLSEDTDYADYYLWDRILQAGYRPRVLISEYNANFLGGGAYDGRSDEGESMTVHAPPKDEYRLWEHNDYYGVSALALKRLWNKYGYIMIYCTKAGINCFGIRETDALVLKGNDGGGNRTAAQKCLWNKPLTSPKKVHPCNTKFETWSQVDKDGNIVPNTNVTPLVLQHCRKVLHADEKEAEAKK